MYKRCKITGNPHITGMYTAFKQTYSRKYNFVGESHNFWELVCVISGTLGVTSKGNVFTLKEGQAILHSPMQFHRIYSENDTEPTVIIFSFDGKDIPEIEDVCKIDNISDVFDIFNSAKKYFKFDKNNILKKIENDKTGNLITVKKLELFLLKLAENSQKGAHINSQRAKNYSLIVKTLEDNIQKRLTVAEVASLCNMSEVNAKKTFSKYAGVGIIEYFNHMKIEKAIELLSNGFSVKETALYLGFSDQNYFSTVFKRISGHSPSKLK